MAIRAYQKSELAAMTALWNHIVEEGLYFPQTEPMDEEQGAAFFAEQSHTGVAVEETDGSLLGLYILHPNNVGRCGHIANASYAVQPGLRGRHIGEALVRDSMKTAAALGFRILQFNAVVSLNERALHLYEKIGFTRLGVVPGGFLLNNGSYADIIPMYISLV